MHNDSVDSSRIVIFAENLRYVYPDGTVGIDNASLFIEEGEKVALIGPNGCGKSTLLMLFAGLLRPTSGTLKIFGRNVSKENYEFFRKNTGILFQNPDDFLFNPTVLDELLYTPINMGMSYEEAMSLAIRYAKEFEIEHILEKQPFRLSGGEKKRVALACVLMLRPKLLLLDEPMNNIDGKTKRKIIDVLKTYENTLVVSTHETHYLDDIVNKVIVFSEEKKVLRIGGRELLQDEDTLLRAGVL
ncbi:MAG: energy-coupling factor ABC transporter ATP-binding protein [Crenarchaeota archaeon]|nr:energy-coupling factor ABC transporter ATP-binding protein [Thermoproteota archaeon]